MNEWSGFWSYARQDNLDDGGRILELREDLSARVRIRTGGDFRIFADNTDLLWGDDWEATLADILRQTAFLIPIVSPTYFLSRHCRKELLSFSSTAQSLALTELILPIYYITTEQLEKQRPGEDEVVDLIHKYEWEDFRAAALEDRGSSGYRKAVDRLAEQLIKRATLADSKPALADPGVVAAPNPTGPTGADSGQIQNAEESDEDGDRLERLVAGEAAMAHLAETTTHIGFVLEHMGTEAQLARTNIAKSDEQGRGFAGRLQVSRSFAGKLSECADELEPLVKAFSADLLIVDPTTRLALRLLAESGEIHTADADDYIAAIKHMAESAIPSLSQMLDLARTVIANSKWSKDLRTPSARIDQALRQLADAREVFEEWLRLIAEAQAS
jgi:hypothetical protein